MVGRSKGCRTCVRRKVRCDEGKPTCKRCEKGRFKCEGYAREHRFVDEVARTVQHAQHLKKTPSKSVAPVRSHDEIPSSSEGLVLQPNLSFAAFQDNITVSFLLSHIFDGNHDPTNPWLQRQAEDTTSLTAQNSILALGKVYFGRMHHQRDIVNQGLVLYSDALHNLNQDLQDDEKAWSLSTLNSSMTLQLYEFVAFSSNAGWLQHAGGLGRMIQLRGPSKHQTRFERHLLEGNRPTIALECWIKRKRCFLETPDWKTIPWALEPESKTAAMYLHDILCSLPGLMEDATSLQSPELTPEQNLALYQVLLDKMTTYLADVYAWRALWEEANSSACCEIPNPSVTDEENPIFPTILHYSSLATATDITFYNAILLLFYQLGFEVMGSSFSPNSLVLTIPTTQSHNPLYLPGHAPSPQAIATEICRSADYHLLEKQSSAGAFCLLFPLRVAYQVFAAGAREKIWMEALMRRTAELTGWEIGRNLGGNAVVGR